MARLLATHRAELAAPAGPLARFATAPVRVLLRQTAAYAALYNDAQHPYVLGDALERERRPGECLRLPCPPPRSTFPGHGSHGSRPSGCGSRRLCS